MKKILIGLFVLFIIHYSLFIIPAYAQSQPTDMATLYPIADTNAVDGDILLYSDKALSRASASYSNRIFGVLQDNPLLVYKSLDQKGKPVVRAGIAYVNVTDAGGTIKAGDFITSSATAGKGQKSTISGYVLGMALGNLTGPRGKIPVAVRIEYTELTNTRSVLHLLDYFNVAAFQTAQNPERAAQFVKYGAAGLIVVASLLLSFFIFSRSIGKSIEAIGRNPLAKRAIQLSLVINAALTIVTILIGVAAAYVILLL